VLEPPQVQGILSFDESAIMLRLAIKVKPSQHGAAELELRRRIKEAFDREGVEIPVPRRVVLSRQETDGVNGEGEALKRLPKQGQTVGEAQDPADKESPSPSPPGRGQG
jgi:small-conductance mechanosensitive channel